MRLLITILIACTLSQSCIQTGLFEKHVTFKDHAWSSSFKPEIRFDVTDTTSAYNIFFVVRHTDAFAYNNLWVRIKSKSPGDSAFSTQQFDLPLAEQNRWTGTGMDDIFEHRILLFRRPVKFSKPGQYQFIIEHIMRENPLQEIMNVGVRLEKTGQQ